MNLNDKVSVILTDYGKQILNEYVNGKDIHTHLVICDKNNKFTTLMWILMNIFDKHMTWDSKEIFKDNDIFVEE